MSTAVFTHQHLGDLWRARRNCSAWRRKLHCADNFAGKAKKDKTIDSDNDDTNTNTANTNTNNITTTTTTTTTNNNNNNNIKQHKHVASSFYKM